VPPAYYGFAGERKKAGEGGMTGIAPPMLDFIIHSNIMNLPIRDLIAD
jgi:hypothetical protein